MARILLFFYGGNDADLIECPQHIADNLPKYQCYFDKWIYDIKNQHNYWEKDCNGELGVCFDGEAFLEWLNNKILTTESEKAFFIKRNYVPMNEEKDLPRIYF